jgi:hypothetical protein
MITERINKHILEKDESHPIGRILRKGLDTPGVQLPLFLTGVTVYMSAIVVDETIESVRKKVYGLRQNSSEELYKPLDEPTLPSDDLHLDVPTHDLFRG